MSFFDFFMFSAIVKVLGGRLPTLCPRSGVVVVVVVVVVTVVVEVKIIVLLILSLSSLL